MRFARQKTNQTLHRDASLGLASTQSIQPPVAWPARRGAGRGLSLPLSIRSPRIVLVSVLSLSGPVSAMAQSPVFVMDDTTSSVMIGQQNTNGWYNGPLLQNSNTWIGIGAGVTNSVSASNNVGVGSSVLFALTTGGSNTAVGQGAQACETTAGNNTSIGQLALTNNSTGQNNTALGMYAQYGDGCTSSGDDNTSSGFYSLFSVTSGSNNVADGSYALYANTTGGTNGAFGFTALASNTTGNANTAVGTGALYSSTTGDGNVAIGDGALGSAVTGNYNISLGLNSGYNLTGGSNNIYLGLNIAADDPNENEKLNIGNFIKADLSWWHLHWLGRNPSLVKCPNGSLIDGNATDMSGTVFVAGASASCTVKFANAFYSFNHCRVFPHSLGNPFSYSYSLSSIGVSFTGGGTGVTFDYACDGK